MSGIGKQLLPIAGGLLGAAIGAPFLGPMFGAGIGGISGATLGAAAGGLAGSTLFGMLGGEDKPPESTVLQQAPTTQPTAMPAPNDSAVQAAQRRRIVEQQTRMGRSSTILSQGSLLGNNNAGEKLGAA